MFIDHSGCSLLVLIVSSKGKQCWGEAEKTEKEMRVKEEENRQRGTYNSSGDRGHPYFLVLWCAPGISSCKTSGGSIAWRGPCRPSKATVHHSLRFPLGGCGWVVRSSIGCNPCDFACRKVEVPLSCQLPNRGRINHFLMPRAFCVLRIWRNLFTWNRLWNLM